MLYLGREGILPKAAEETAAFLSFMDQLFDSVNGSSSEADHRKLLRCAIKEGSLHINHWEKCIKTLQSMKFVTKKGDKVPPSITIWIKTLRGFIHIWKKLSGTGFKFLCIRRVNQDPLENFFGCVRSHGVRNINPTCYSFVNSFKTLIVNNFTSPHSPNGNCKNDEGDALNCLKSLLSCDADKKEPLAETKNTAIIATHAYIAG